MMESFALSYWQNWFICILDQRLFFWFNFHQILVAQYENYCKVTSSQEIGCTLNKVIVILLLASPEIPDCHHVSPSVPDLSEIPAITNPPAWLSTRDAGVILLQNFPDTQKFSRSIIAKETFLS